MELDDTLCYCFHVSKRKVINHLKVQRPRRASQLSDCGGAGTGCGWCVPYLKRYFAQWQATGSAGSDLETETVEDYSQGRAAYIEAGKGKPPASP